MKLSYPKLARKPPKLNDENLMGISGIFRESRDILGAYLGFLQNYSWQRLIGVTLKIGYSPVCRDINTLFRFLFHFMFL